MMPEQPPPDRQPAMQWFEGGETPNNPNAVSTVQAAQLLDHLLRKGMTVGAVSGVLVMALGMLVTSQRFHRPGLVEQVGDGLLAAYREVTAKLIELDDLARAEREAVRARAEGQLQ